MVHSWWHRCAAFAKAAEAQQYRATLQIQRSFSRWAQKSAAGAFLWWRRVVASQKALESANRAKERALAVLERVAVRYLRRSVSGSFEVWDRALAIERQRQRGVHLFDVVLRQVGWAVKAAAFLRMQREAEIQRQLSHLKCATPPRAIDTIHKRRPRRPAGRCRPSEARLVNEFASERAASARGPHTLDGRAGIVDEPARARRSPRWRGEGRGARSSSPAKRRGRERATERVRLQTDRTAAAHACALAEARLLYGD